MVTKLKRAVVVKGDDDSGKLGLVHIYTGDGKGKTTASLGLALRALGNGFRVYMIQFLKSGFTGEVKSAGMFGDKFIVEQFGVDALVHREKILRNFQDENSNFVFQPDEMERQAAQLGLQKAIEVVKSGEYQLVILDEVNVALDKGLISLEDIRSLLEEHDRIEIVLTGRDPPKELYEHADYVSVMGRVKHPWQKGIVARKGIEY